jgi:HEAT repeat protein
MGRVWLLVPFVLALAATLLGVPLPSGERIALSSPLEFLTDKESKVAGIVTIQRVETRVISEPETPHVLLVQAQVDEVWRGGEVWQPHATVAFIQGEYWEPEGVPEAPAAIPGKRYVVWVDPSDDRLQSLARWYARPRAVLLIRTDLANEFVYWRGTRYTVEGLREAITGDKRLSLDQILDPLQRLNVAYERINRGELGARAAFIHGLTLILEDPEGQARHVRPPEDPSADDAPTESQQGAHSLVDQSLRLLRALGRDDTCRPDVVRALTRFTVKTRPAIRLATALALAEIGSDAGRESLIQGFETHSDWHRKRLADQDLGDFYPRDGSAAACSYALARLGDSRGLQSSRPALRLAAAEAITADADVREVARGIAEDLQPEVDKRVANPGPCPSELPKDWVRAERLLALGGDDTSLRRLAEGYLWEANSCPGAEDFNLETGANPFADPRIVGIGPWAGAATVTADTNRPRLLQRLRGMFAGGAEWGTPAFQLMRMSLGDSSASEPPADDSYERTQRAKVPSQLQSRDSAERVGGIASAGAYGLDAYYNDVLDAALGGSDPERIQAAASLAAYDRDLPDPTVRRLLTDGPLEGRLIALEWATRKDPQRFAVEAMRCLRDTEADPRGKTAATENLGMFGYDVRHLPSVLSRVARGPLPAEVLKGLEDKDQLVRRAVLQALGIGGNPEAISHVARLLRDPGPSVRHAAKVALDLLGTGEP